MFSTENIAFLKGPAYLAELALVRENDSSLVHVAQIATAAHGTRQVFVKAFPAKFQSNGLLNELIGYLIAKAAGLPVADSGYVLVLPSEQLFRIHPDRKALLASESGLSITWATSAIEGSPLRVLRSTKEIDMQRRLRKWGMLPHVLAFDDLICNEDRTDDNLIAVRNGEFALVDHAEIAGGLTRFHMPDPGVGSKNRLIHDIFGASIPTTIKSGMVLAAEQHERVVKSALHEINSWIAFLSRGLQTTEHPVVSFLRERARRSPDRIRKDYGLLI